MVRGAPARYITEAEISEKVTASNFKTEVKRTFPAISDFWDDTVFMGAFSWSVVGEKRRIIDRYAAINLPGASTTPSGYARAYLTLKYDRNPAATRPQLDACNTPRSQAMMARPGRYEDMVYVDVRSAYWSILKLVAWDTDYHPGRWWGVGGSMRDFPLPEHKMARNMLVTVGTTRSATVWSRGRVSQRLTGNHLLNMPLWAAVQDTLHMVALRAVAFDAVYVNTDGYIMPARNEAEFSGWLGSVGLRSSVKHAGDCEVWGVGRYQFPDSRKLTKREKSGGFTYAINDVPAYWIEERLRAFARHRRSEGDIE